MARETKLWVKALLPFGLVIILLLLFLKFGPLGVFKASVPPIEEVFIEKVTFSPEQITLKVFNDGPEPVTIAQVLVNDVYWKFDMTPSQTLKPLQRGYININYPWNDGDTEFITLISRNGVTFDKEVAVAFTTPQFNWVYFRTFILLGLYVGVIPVLLGLLWFPVLKKLKERWYLFLLALTVGLLVFLGVDALAESFELVGDVPRAFNGIGVLAMGFILAILILSAVSYKTEHFKAAHHTKTLVWAYLIALAIGIHNFGEGLAIGSAYAIGEIALGATLVIGFMIHNVTEGVAIVAPVTRTFHYIRRFVPHLIIMGIIAGAPTILGTLIGGFSYSPLLAIAFLAIGAGAIFDVSYDILHHMANGRWLSLFTITNVFGFLAGLLIMYLTAFAVLG